MILSSDVSVKSRITADSSSKLKWEVHIVKYVILIELIVRYVLTIVVGYVLATVHNGPAGN